MNRENEELLKIINSSIISEYKETKDIIQLVKKRREAKNKLFSYYEKMSEKDKKEIVVNSRNGFKIEFIMKDNPITMGIIGGIGIIGSHYLIINSMIKSFPYFYDALKLTYFSIINSNYQ